MIVEESHVKSRRCAQVHNGTRADLVFDTVPYARAIYLVMAAFMNLAPSAVTVTVAVPLAKVGV